MGTGAAIGAGEMRHRRAGHYSSVMPGHSRSKNGVASLAYVPGIHALLFCETKGVDGRNKPGHDECLRIFAVVSSIFGRVEGMAAMFHVKCFTIKGLEFRGLERCTIKFVDCS
jgi:hypothetical protein